MLNNIPNIFYTIGMPRSGKTTFAKWFAKHWADVRLLVDRTYQDWMTIPADKPMVLIDEDTIRRVVTGQRFAAGSEELVRTMKHAMIKTLVEDGNRVIVADTHSRPESFWPLYKIDNNALGFYLESTVNICQFRADQAGYNDLIKPIKRIGANLSRNESPLNSADNIMIVKPVFVPNSHEQHEYKLELGPNYGATQ